MYMQQAPRERDPPLSGSVMVVVVVVVFLVVVGGGMSVCVPKLQFLLKNWGFKGVFLS